MCEYDLNYGPLDPISGAVGAALDSAVQLLQGVKQIGASLSGGRGNVRSHSNEESGSVERGTNTNGPKGAGKATRAVVQAPVNTGVAITQGIHNAPRLWGGQVSRKQPCVTGLRSGLKAGGNVGNLPTISSNTLPVGNI